MNIPQACDIAVLGGGPAGSLAATFLARAGYDVVLLEKQAHPRPTVGESLIPDFWRYCDDAGCTGAIEAEQFIRKAGGTVDWHGETRHVAFKDFGYTRPALHVERDRFDEILLRHAAAQGVQVFERVSVHEVDLAPERPTVAWRTADDSRAGKLQCRVVVDASGQACLIGRQLGLRRMDDAFRFMSVWGYFENSKYFAADGSVHAHGSAREQPPTTYVASVPDAGDWGWIWHITMRRTTSVGFVLPRETIRAVKQSGQSWQSFFLQRCDSMPRLKMLLSDARLVENSVRVIRDYSYRSARFSDRNSYLVGDAAGFVDPIFSIGVLLGMYSARGAAWAIDRGLRAPQKAEHYRNIYESQLADRMEMARTLALPQYTVPGGSVSMQARKVMQFSASHAQALTHAAASLVGRAENFRALVGHADGAGRAAGE